MVIKQIANISFTAKNKKPLFIGFLFTQPRFEVVGKYRLVAN